MLIISASFKKRYWNTKQCIRFKKMLIICNIKNYICLIDNRN